MQIFLILVISLKIYIEYEKPSYYRIAVDFVKHQANEIIGRITRGFMKIWSKI